MVNRNRFRIILLIFILFSVYTFIFSESGLLERMRLNSRYEELQQNLSSLKKSNEELKELCSGYRSGNYSEKDIINSGLIFTGSKVVVFEQNYSSKSPVYDDFDTDFQLDPSHLRIIWIIISFMILIYYINRLKNRDEALDG